MAFIKTSTCTTSVNCEKLSKIRSTSSSARAAGPDSSVALAPTTSKVKQFSYCIVHLWWSHRSQEEFISSWETVRMERTIKSMNLPPKAEQRRGVLRSFCSLDGSHTWVASFMTKLLMLHQPHRLIRGGGHVLATERRTEAYHILHASVSSQARSNLRRKNIKEYNIFIVRASQLF